MKLETSLDTNISCLKLFCEAIYLFCPTNDLRGTSWVGMKVTSYVDRVILRLLDFYREKSFKYKTTSQSIFVYSSVKETSYNIRFDFQNS